MRVEDLGGTGWIAGSEGGVYRVLLDGGEVVEALLPGRLKRARGGSKRIVIGDRVQLGGRPGEDLRIERVEERRSELIRSGPGGRRPKVVAANLDRIFVVVSVTRPRLSRPLLDRLLVVSEASHIPAVVVLNKVDLLTVSLSDGRSSKVGEVARSVATLYGRIGYRVLRTSALGGEGLGELRELLAEGVSALIGPSGTGKSSLLNAIQPSLGLRTGELSHRAGRGRHTTVSARLIRLDGGGLVADTPGFSDVGTWGIGAVALESCFPEFAPYREHCRFRGCTHLHEPECAVAEALARGEIDRGRFESYRALAREAGGV